MSSLDKLYKEFELLKMTILESNKNSMSIGGWINRKTMLRFFDYSDNHLRALEKKELLITSTIGRRKFYQINSIIKLLEKNAK